MTKEELEDQLKELNEVIHSAVEMHNAGMNLNKEIVDLLKTRDRLVELIEKKES